MRTWRDIVFVVLFWVILPIVVLGIFLFPLWYQLYIAFTYKAAKESEPYEDSNTSKRIRIVFKNR
jgi:hypothetical protein